MSKKFKWKAHLIGEFLEKVFPASTEEFKQSHTPKPQAENKPDYSEAEKNLLKNFQIKPQPQKEEQGIKQWGNKFYLDGQRTNST